MDGKEEDRSLRWRRNERVDFDMCANSPPSDGFFYASHSRTEISQSSEGCEKKIYSKNIPKETFSSSEQEGNSGQERMLKSFAPGNYSAASEMQGTGGESAGKLLKMDSAELERWAKSNIRGQGELTSHSSDDTALTPIDHIPQFQRGVPTVKVTDAGSSLADKLQQAQSTHTTPYSTPNITPVCSPAGSRRAVANPFFTGIGFSEKKKEEGSWLFKSPPPENVSYQQYEAKVGTQSGTETQSKKNVRYVPKPSQLRELNFFSPTSS